MAGFEQDRGGGLIDRWRARRATRQGRRAAAHRLYGQIVAMAREPGFYARWGVPDTNDGRLEMIGLHAALVMRRLAREAEAGPALAQELFDLMFADVDRNLRELGVGDLSVGKKVKGIAQSFLGRAAGLEAALGRGDRAAVTAVLARNLYLSGTAPPAERIDALAGHLMALDAALAAFPGERLLDGALPPHRAPG
jgi:cytochrome b pre-mRNA-processing protein 3